MKSLKIKVIAVVIVISCAIVLIIIFTKRLVKPLIELTEATKKIADGDLGVSIEHHSHDEVGALAESFRQTVDKLNQYIQTTNIKFAIMAFDINN